MTHPLPAPIAGYIEEDNAGGDTARWFAENAEVRDEGSTHRGRDAIATWKRAAHAAYDYRSAVTGVEPGEVDGQHIVTCHVTGSFPGGEVMLRYRFTLVDGLIVRLEIAP